MKYPVELRMKYQVEEYFEVFEADELETKSLTITTVFDSEDLLCAKSLAESFFYQKDKEIGNSSFAGLPYHSPEGFINGKHSANSVTLSILEDGIRYDLSDNSDGIEGYILEAKNLEIVLGEEDKLEFDKLWSERFIQIVKNNPKLWPERFIQSMKNNQEN